MSLPFSLFDFVMFKSFSSLQIPHFLEEDILLTVSLLFSIDLLYPQCVFSIVSANGLAELALLYVALMVKEQH